MRRSAKRVTQSLADLADACDLVVRGLKSGAPFGGNPEFINAIETTARVLRGNVTKIHGLKLSPDRQHLMIRIAENDDDESPNP